MLKILLLICLVGMFLVGCAALRSQFADPNSPGSRVVDAVGVGAAVAGSTAATVPEPASTWILVATTIIGGLIAAFKHWQLSQIRKSASTAENSQKIP